MSTHITDDTLVLGTVAEPEDVATVLGNLFGNAVTAAAAAPEPRRVDVTLLDEGDTLVLIVADSGAGIFGRSIVAAMSQARARIWGPAARRYARRTDSHDRGRILMGEQWRVLVIDDDFRVAGMHAELVESVNGFTVAGIVRSVAEARRALRSGVLGYLIKPFLGHALTERLDRYARFRHVLSAGQSLTQDHVDRALAVPHAPVQTPSATE